MKKFFDWVSNYCRLTVDEEEANEVVNEQMGGESRTRAVRSRNLSTIYAEAWNNTAINTHFMNI